MASAGGVARKHLKRRRCHKRIASGVRGGAASALRRFARAAATLRALGAPLFSLPVMF